MRDRCETLGEIVSGLLRRMVRELLARKPGGHLVESRLDRLDLEMSIRLRGPASDPAVFAGQLTSALDRLIDEAVEHAAAFRPGRAYCHRCQSPDCEHSPPPSCRHVFVGYTPTGVPRWADFAQHCLELKHPLVDRLYDDPPAMIVLVQEEESLHREMLPAFQAGACELLGQVTAGFFSVPSRAGDGRGVLALTIQVAGSKPAGGRLRLGLNLLGKSPAGDELHTLWDRLEELPWHRSVRWAQNALQSVSAAASAAATTATRRRVAGILGGLARRLSRDQRARSRKTRHAQQRHASGDRPTRKAIDDARHRGGRELLVDERRGTLVVVGDRGRTHFFTAAGQHVSSVRYSRDAIARKRKLERWRKASSDETESFLSRLPP